MIRFFVEYRLSWFIIGPLLILLFHILNFLTGSYVNPLKIDLGLLGLYELNPLFSKFCSGLLILLNGLNLTRIFNENDFYDKTIFSTGFVYIVLMSFFHSFYYLSPVLIVQTILIVILREILLIKQQEGDQKHVFNGAIMLGIGLCIHPPMVIFILAYFISIWSIKSFQLRDFFLILTGLVLPFLYVGSSYFLSDKIIILDLFNAPSKWKIVVFDMLFMLIVFSFLFIISMVSFRSNAFKSTLRLRKMMLPVWLFFGLCLLLGIYDLIFFFQIERISLIMCTLPFFINYAFIHRSYNLFVGILFFLALGYSIVKFFTVLPHG